MITETQYNILIKCKNVPQLFDNAYKSEFAYLITNQYLVPEQIQKGNATYNGFRTSKNKGLLAIQEYEDRLKSIDTETRSLQIAEEANRIAKEANEKSKIANLISIWSIVISAILSAGAIIASILIALFVKPYP